MARLALFERALRLPPVSILVAGWLGFLLYAHPGYLSRDAIDQLVAARSGDVCAVEPVAMTALWKVVDFAIPGPFGMLVLQSACFVAGIYLLIERITGQGHRTAAVAAVGVLWFPPIGATLAVIWPASLFCGLVALGAGLVASSRSRLRITGLLLLGFAATLRDAGWMVTLPLVATLFAARPHGVRRYALALAAWLGITLVGRAAVFLTDTPAQAEPASLGDRWEGFVRVLTPDRPDGTAAYTWFTDVHDLQGSAGLIRHDGVASGLQSVLQRCARWLGTTWLFSPWLYLVIAIALVPLSPDRETIAWLVSGLASEVVLISTQPSDATFRTSAWLVVTAVVAGLGRACRSARRSI